MEGSRPPDVDKVTETLRANPVFAGLSEDKLDEIARILAEETSARVAEALRTVPLFADLPDADLERIRESTETIQVAAGDAVYRAGEEGDTLYTVVQGAVELSADGDGGHPVRVAPGEAFGQAGFFDDAPRESTATAVEPSVLAALGRDAFTELLGGDTLATRVLRTALRASAPPPGAAPAETEAEREETGSGAERATAADDVPAPSGGEHPFRDAVRDLGRVIHRTLLPDGLPHADGYLVSTTTRPLKDGDGSSIWDAFPLADGRTVVSLTAATVEGVPAAHALAVARAAMREAALGRDSLEGVLSRVSEALAACRVEGLDQRVEACLLAIGEDEVQWSCAGRKAGAVVRAGGNVVDLPTDPVHLGLRRDHAYRTYDVPVLPGDFVFAFAGHEPDLLDTARESILGAMEDGPGQILPRLAADLADREGVERETSALVLKKLPDDGPDAPGPRGGRA